MTDEPQDTATKQPIDNPISGNRPFVKGDKRINRKGRPKNFDQLRALAQKIADEALLTPEGKITRIEALLRVLTSSRAPADRALFLAYAYGKPREQIDVNIPGATITLNWRTLEKDDEHNTPPTTPAPG